MAKQPFIYSKLDDAFSKCFIQEVEEISNSMRDGYISEANTLRYNHGISFRSPVNNASDDTREMKRHSSFLELSYSDIIRGRVEKIFFDSINVSKILTESVTGELLKVVSDASKKSGMVIDGSNKSVHEAFYNILEKMDLTLDANGELSMPTIFVSPDGFQKIQNAPPADEEFNKRLEALKQKKKQDALDREMKRLSRFERDKQ